MSETKKTIIRFLCFTAAIVMLLLLVYLYFYLESEGSYAYRAIDCKALQWSFPEHSFDTESGREWNSLRIYALSAAKMEELLAFAGSNAWKPLPLTDSEKDDAFLKDYPDQNISSMKEAQQGYWNSIMQKGRRYLCVIDAQNARLYIRSSSILE